jgi:hypothetical protein
MMELITDLGMLYATTASKERKRYGIYKCECGAEFKAITTQVKNGHTKSCGCLQKKKAAEAQTTHGLSRHPLYMTWKKMVSRCHSEKSSDYKYYGARGITVCDEWKNNFKDFYTWSLSNGYSEDLSIDRRDNDLGYAPSNCRWTTQSKQSQNTRTLRSNNTSGYRGVSFHKGAGKWQVAICVERKVTYLGLYDDEEEASKVFNKYVRDNALEHKLAEGA